MGTEHYLFEGILMLSPYQRSQGMRREEIPELRSDVLFGKRLLNALLIGIKHGERTETEKAYHRFADFARSAFPESLLELIEEIQIGLRYQAEAKLRSPLFYKATIDLSAGLLRHGQFSNAKQLLSSLKEQAHFIDDKELRAKVYINLAIASEKCGFSDAHGLWLQGLKEMPSSKWPYYPQLLVGAAQSLRHYREKGDFSDVLEQQDLVAFAYRRLTLGNERDREFQSSEGVVVLLFEIACNQEATESMGIATENLPASLVLFEAAAMYAFGNLQRHDLTARTLLSLAMRYHAKGQNALALGSIVQALQAMESMKPRDELLHRAILSAQKAFLDEGSELDY